MSTTCTCVLCPSLASLAMALSVPAGKGCSCVVSMRVLDVRSAARRRALAVAMREGSGGWGERVVRLVRRDWEGGGRD